MTKQTRFFAILPIAVPVVGSFPNNKFKESPMKRMFSLIALVSVAAVAGPLKVGGDVSGALLIPSFDPSTGTTAKIGFGGKIAPAVEFAINDQFSVRGNVGYEYATYGAEMDLG